MSHLSLAHHTAPGRTFRSAKTAHAVPLPFDLVEAALVQASLDPGVFSIAPVRPPVWSPDADCRAHYVVTNQDGRTGILVARDDAGPDVEPEPGCLPLDVLRPTDLTVEPFASNARLVWACSGRWYPAGDQVRILRFLEDQGESALIEVSHAASASSDPVATVLAMACRALVDLDLRDGPLGPGTRVARRYVT